MSRKLFWRVVRLTYPWLPLAIVLWRIVWLSGAHRIQAKVKFWLLASQINFANIMALAIDLLQPEYWA